MGVALEDKEGLAAGRMSTGFLKALGLSSCCVAHNVKEYVDKALRLAHDDDGVRTAARATLLEKASPQSSSLLFRLGEGAVMTWRRFVKASIERARARGRAFCPPVLESRLRPAVKVARS